MSKFYQFRQNNSGGSFSHDAEEGIGVYVLVEADNADHANARAERIGIYFDGCRDGADCPCCGDRWSEVCEYDGDDTPKVYGADARPVADGEEPKLDWGHPSYVHFIGGEFKPITWGEQP